MNKLQAIKEEVKLLHKKSKNECMRVWFYENHVLVTANYAKEIANKVGADEETAVLAAFFHDIARCWGVDKEPALMNESLAKAQEIMKRRYSAKDIEAVKRAIRRHSCSGKLPDTAEGKVMATADALAHLMTDFYLIFAFNRWKDAKTFEEYRKWTVEKINRDFHKKIFYKEYKEKAKKRYLALKAVFSGG